MSKSNNCRTKARTGAAVVDGAIAETEVEVAAVDGVVDVAVVTKWSMMAFNLWKLPTVNPLREEKKKIP